MQQLAPHASLMANIAWSWIIFALAAVPSYILAAFTMDRIGHRRLQFVGFLGMGIAFLLVGIFPGITEAFMLFLFLYGISYFFAEFGPNTTTFVLAAELYPVNQRTTAHGISAGIAKVGAFLGTFFFPILLHAVGINNALIITFGFSVLGLALTYFFIPEPTGKSLEELGQEEASLAASTEVATYPASA